MKMTIITKNVPEGASKDPDYGDQSMTMIMRMSGNWNDLLLVGHTIHDFSTDHSGVPLQNLAIVAAMMTMMLKKTIEGLKVDQSRELGQAIADAPVVSSLKDVHRLMNVDSARVDPNQTENHMDKSDVNPARMLTRTKT
jgi:hypothetical protein